MTSGRRCQGYSAPDPHRPGGGGRASFGSQEPPISPREVIDASLKIGGERTAAILGSASGLSGASLQQMRQIIEEAKRMG